MYTVFHLSILWKRRRHFAHFSGRAASNRWSFFLFAFRWIHLSLVGLLKAGILIQVCRPGGQKSEWCRHLASVLGHEGHLLDRSYMASLDNEMREWWVQATLEIVRTRWQMCPCLQIAQAYPVVVWSNQHSLKLKALLLPVGWSVSTKSIAYCALVSLVSWGHHLQSLCPDFVSDHHRVPAGRAGFATAQESLSHSTGIALRKSHHVQCAIAFLAFWPLSCIRGSFDDVQAGLPSAVEIYA